MKQRIGKVVGRNLRDFGRLDQPWPMICTFHSLCLRILRHYAPAIGFAGEFLDLRFGRSDQDLKEAIKSLDVSTTNFARRRARHDQQS